MSDTKNVKLGVCKIFYGGVDLGYTQGGVQVAVKTETHKVNVDQFGKTTVDEVIMSRDVTAKVPLAETTLENLVAIMPGAVLNQSGGAAATGSLTVATIPVDGDTVTVNGTVFTFKTASPVGNQVLIGGTVAATATNLKTVLAASAVANVAVATYTVSGAVVTAAYKLQGVLGNAFTLASAQASVTVIAVAGGVNPTVRNVEVTTAVGVSLLAIAKELRLHPVALPDSDKSEDFVIPLAATPGGMDFAYEVEKERIFNCEFTGYPDSANGGKLFKVGA
jgi:hypothetical protein